MANASVEKTQTRHGYDWNIRDGNERVVLKAFSSVVNNGLEDNYRVTIKSALPEQKNGLSNEQSREIADLLRDDLKKQGFVVGVPESGNAVVISNKNGAKLSPQQAEALDTIFVNKSLDMLKAASPKQQAQAQDTAMQTALAQFNDPDKNYGASTVSIPAKAPNGKGVGIA
jgi:hypothetical protein